MNDPTKIQASSGNWKFKATVSIAGMITIIILAAIFRFEVGVILLAGVGIAIIGYSVKGIIWCIGRCFDIWDRLSESKQKHLQSSIHYTPNGIFWREIPNVRYIPPTVGERKGLNNGTIIDQLPQLLDLIKDEPCVVIHGGRGSGKTTVSEHWLSCRPGVVVVCDPKPKGKNPWPTRHIVGCGGKYKDIQKAVYQVRAELRRRVEEQILTATDLTLFLDELYQLVTVQRLEIMQPVFEIITLGRDYKVNAAFTASDIGVKALGIEGMSGLREALTEIECRQVGSEYKSFVDLGNGKQEALPPGRYVGQVAPRLIAGPMHPTPPPLTDKQNQIIELYKSGVKDPAQIAQEVYHGRGGKQIQLVKNILRLIGT